MPFQTLLVDTRDEVTTITLNRPESKNAMNPTLHREMCEALAAVEQNADCRVLVITGAGDSFCAGMDIKEHFQDTAADPQARAASREAAYEWMFKRLRLLPKPTIAAVNGWCLGGALAWLSVCDFAIASEKAKFGLSEVNWGILPAGGATKLVSQMISRRDALHMVMTGQPVNAARAAEMRLVNTVVAHDDLASSVLELADTLKQKHPTVLAYIKEVFREDQGLNLDEALALELKKWHELEEATGSAWQQGARQFKVQRSYRPGLEGYRWKEGA